MKSNGFLDNLRMKAKREQMDDKLMVIKLFASNYARDLLFTYIPFEKSINILKDDNMIMNSKNVFVVAMFMIIFVGVSNQLAMASSSSSSQAQKLVLKTVVQMHL